MFSAAVGRRARTVKVQSSWFCSNRRRRLFTHVSIHAVSSRSSRKYVLFSCDPINAHALSCLGQLPEGILAQDISHPDHAESDSKLGTISAQPSARSVYHASSIRYICVYRIIHYSSRKEIGEAGTCLR